LAEGSLGSDFRLNVYLDTVMKKAIRMHGGDNVANVLEDVAPGDPVACAGEGCETVVTAKEAIPFGFKIAVTHIARGDPILKYAHIIGKASAAIVPGALVHIHNVEGARGRGDDRGADKTKIHPDSV
jgi:altronate dehydratase small subunit